MNVLRELKDDIKSIKYLAVSLQKVAVLKQEMALVN